MTVCRSTPGDHQCEVFYFQKTSFSRTDTEALTCTGDELQCLLNTWDLENSYVLNAVFYQKQSEGYHLWKETCGHHKQISVESVGGVWGCQSSAFWYEATGREFITPA